MESYWNDPIDGVFAEILIPDYNIKFPTPSLNLQGFGKATLEGFFDTTGIEEDGFRAIVTLSYAGKSEEFPITLRFRREPNYVVYAIVAVGVLLFVLAIVMFWLRKIRQRRERKNARR